MILEIILENIKLEVGPLWHGKNGDFWDIVVQVYEGVFGLSDVYFRSSIMFFRPSDGASRRRDQWGPVARTPIFANDTATVERFQNSQRQTQLLTQKGQVSQS